ncbi:hypothetical protein [Janthinobacterium sp. SUN206]|uniref:hypothetical protein n=1 Tax=Janthinobacterium sp. SUN206 TaxID=3014787 RepID=UPI002712DB24|nr:hypothetical protein [Janthinobacterium sp. SUN206]MDO8067908.1 hypothetical protein [Janthinobacterium sp. SUN206]
MRSARLQLTSKFILFQIHCAAGVLVQGGAPDLLLIISQAREAKELWARYLPYSNLRMKFFYPSRKRIPSADVSAALRALANPAVASAVALRRAVASQSSIVCAPARAGEICDATAEGGAVGVDVVFSQAGVVAPPDSLTGETFNNYRDVGKPV